MRGRIRHRLRLGPVALDKYLAGQVQGLAYMRRLRAIEDEESRHLRELEEAQAAIAAELADDEAFAHAWRETAERWDFRRINELVARHNEYFPIEAQVPMNPRTGGYAASWKREPYDADWILGRFPPRRPTAADGAEEASGSEPQAPGRRDGTAADRRPE